MIAAGTSAFEALQGKPPQILGHAPVMRKGAFRAQRTGEHTVAINLLLLSLQYEPLTASEMSDIGEALAKSDCVNVTAAQRARLAVARFLANPKRLERKGEPPRGAAAGGVRPHVERFRVACPAQAGDGARARARLSLTRPRMLFARRVAAAAGAHVCQPRVDR